MAWATLWAEIMSWDWATIGSVAGVLGAIFALYGLIISRSEVYRKKRTARKALFRSTKAAHSAMKLPVFPRSINQSQNAIIPEIKDFYYDEIKVTCLNNNKKRNPLRLKKSFILYGESGCGKSAIMRRMLNKTLRMKQFFPSIGVLFFEQSSISAPIERSSDQQKLLSQVQAATFRRLYLYIDGTDEQVSSLQLENLQHFIADLQSSTKKLILRISTRSYMMDKIQNALVALHLDCYEIERWNDRELHDFAVSVLHRVEKKTKVPHTKIKQFFQNNLNFGNIAYSPLLCKLLLYNMLIDNAYSPQENPFQIYRSFIENIQRYSELDESVFVDTQVIDFAREVYGHYYQRELVCYLDSNQMFGAILKQAGNGKYTFIHQSFYEFFVAVYFQHCIKGLSPETARMFTTDYVNSFADFISAALSECDSISIIQVLIEIYSYTLKRTEYKKYSKMFTFGYTPNIDSYIKKLGKEQFITLKFMIVNRIGRLNAPENPTRAFLEFVYENDNHVSPNTIQLIDDELRYYRAVLKRCCAISASFLGICRIELDYVCKMTGCFDSVDYDSYFDTANRSHTLLYYGDYSVPIALELQFRDKPNFNCRKACRKRLNHLRELNTQVSLVGMSSKELRWHRFRLFDIGTLYCFANNRKTNGGNPFAMMGLSNDDVVLLRSFKSDFEGDSPERISAIRHLQKQTIELLQ